MMNRRDRMRELRRLDPARDDQRIVYLMAAYEFPWDLVRALELALFRTFCSPSVSRLLDATGAFRDRGQRRYDDTGLLIAEFMRWGYESRRGERAIARMNAIHGRFRIANRDYLYVLSTFVLDPLRWLDAYGWRPLLEVERRGLFHFFRAVGARMGIADLPATLAEMTDFARAYEAEHFVYAPSNRRVADATLHTVESWLPRPARGLVSPTVRALIDEPMRRALGYAPPPRLWAQAVHTALVARARALRYLPGYRRPYFATAAPARSYPDGYRIEDLGDDPGERPRRARSG